MKNIFKLFIVSFMLLSTQQTQACDMETIIEIHLRIIELEGNKSMLAERLIEEYKKMLSQEIDGLACRLRVLIENPHQQANMRYLEKNN